MTLDELRKDSDWKESFKYAYDPSNPLTREAKKDKRYTRDEVVRVVGHANGENDGPAWVGLFEMNDGVFLYLEAGCDFTGWGCHEEGHSEWTTTEQEAIAAMPAEARERMGLTGGAA